MGIISKGGGWEGRGGLSFQWVSEKLISIDALGEGKGREGGIWHCCC